MLRAAFYYGDGRNPSADFYDKLICFWTGSPYSHCEWVFSDDTFFSSSPRDGGCRFKKIEQDHKWWIIDCPQYEEKVVRSFCERVVGRKYDWTGIMLSQVLPLSIEDPKRYFCSEVMGASIDLIRPNSFNPATLFDLLDAPNRTNF